MTLRLRRTRDVGSGAENSPRSTAAAAVDSSRTGCAIRAAKIGAEDQSAEPTRATAEIAATRRSCGRTGKLVVEIAREHDGADAVERRADGDQPPRSTAESPLASTRADPPRSRR